MTIPPFERALGLKGEPWCYTCQVSYFLVRRLLEPRDQRLKLVRHCGLVHLNGMFELARFDANPVLEPVSPGNRRAQDGGQFEEARGLHQVCQPFLFFRRQLAGRDAAGVTKACKSAASFESNVQDAGPPVSGPEPDQAATAPAATESPSLYLLRSDGRRCGSGPRRRCECPELRSR